MSRLRYIDVGDLPLAIICYAVEADFPGIFEQRRNRRIGDGVEPGHG